jgi:hypothetical protein
MCALLCGTAIVKEPWPVNFRCNLAGVFELKELPFLQSDLEVRVQIFAQYFMSTVGV